jgi:PAS domain S-box-containing protein
MGLWQFNYYSVFYIAAIILSLISVYRSYKMQPVRGAREFSFLSISISIWCIGYLLNFYNTELYFKLLFFRIEYLGILSAGYFWFIFIITYTNYETLLNRKSFILLGIIPFISYILVLTVTQNHYFYHTYGLSKINGLTVFRKEYAIGFYAATAYNYLLVITGTLILLHAVQQMSGKQRNQMIPIFILTVIILLSNLCYIIKINPFFPYDITPVSFVILGIGFNILNFQYDFLDVVPTAYNQVFRNVKSGIIIIDQRGFIIELNPYAEEIISYSGKALGKPLSNVFPECAELLKNSSVEEIKTELQPGNKLKTFSINVSSIKNRNGKTLSKIIMLYDITDLKNALDDLDTFAHTVAHDLKTPLCSLIGFSEILESGDLSDELKAESLNIIKTSSIKMIQIVNGILLLAGFRREKNIQVHKINTKSIIKNSLSRLDKLISEKGGVIRSPEEWPAAAGYEPWVEEIWVNYISNALKYSGVPPEISLGADKENGYVKFWVKDNGNGLCIEDQQKLFKEFDRLAYRNDEAGYGLGLSIVKRILLNLNGNAGVESTIGKGSKFFFTLPSYTD